jgi:hypothetical protein
LLVVNMPDAPVEALAGSFLRVDGSRLTTSATVDDTALQHVVRSVFPHVTSSVLG